jgi:hypothetical protein
MAAPTQIAVIGLEHHDGRTPDTGSCTARILNIGAGTGGTYTLSGADVAAGALVVPLVPVSALVSAPTLTVENIGEEPVITASDGGISVTIAAGIYAGTYTARHDGVPLTTAMIAAAPTCLRKPAVTGATAAGATLTVTPGLWIYAGADPGDQSWVQRIDGVANGETDLDYVIQAADAGKGFTVEETFGGVTVTSAVTAL